VAAPRLTLPPVPDADVARIEALLERVARRLFREDRALLLALVERAKAQGGDWALRQALERFAADVQYGERFRAWVRAYHDLLRQSVEVAGSHLRATLGDAARARPGVPGRLALGFDFGLTNPRVSLVLHDRAVGLARHVGETTARKVIDVLRTGYAEGQGVAQLATRIRRETAPGAEGSPMSRARATLIARTEGVGAMQYANHLAATESGVFRTIEWMAVRDGRTRDSHRALDGMRVPIGARFPNGLRHPGDPDGHISERANCRCSAGYHLEAA
jgi:SPP1 gp7 family putative phage head morphogenesis protein